MKTLIKYAFAIIAPLIAFSCAKEGNVAPTGGADAGVGNTIDVLIDGVIDGYVADDTKAVAENVVRVMWKGGEIVYVYEGKTYLGTLTASVEDADSTYAKLSGTITAPVGGKPITLLYDNESEPVFFPDGSIFLNFSEQMGEDVHFTIYSVVSTLDGRPVGNRKRTISDKVAAFRLATSVYKCNCANLPDADVSVAEIGTTNTGCVINLSDTSEPAIEGSTPGTITRTGGFITTAQGKIFSVGLPPSSAVEKRTVEVTAGGKNYVAAFSKTAFASAKAYNALFTFEPTAGRFSVAADRQVYFAKGNLWYDRNTSGPGFKTEENQYDYKVGSYHQEAPPYWDWDSNHVSHFYWSKESGVAYNKTYNDTELGTGDVLFTNETPTTANKDFTVVVDGEKQEGVWRVLSGGPDGEWQYLLERRKMKYDKPRYTNCSHGVRISSLIYNGLFIYPDDYNGVEVGGREGPDTWEKIDAADIVFLPATGARGGDNPGDRVYFINDHSGTYWSGTPDPDDSEKACCLFFSAEEYPYYDASYEDIRRDGISIRLVRDVK